MPCNKITKLAQTMPPRRILRFEFNAACATLLADHPRLAANTTFIHTVKKDGQPASIRVYASQDAIRCTLPHPQTHLGLRKLINDTHKNRSSYAQAFPHSKTQALVFTPHSVLHELFPHRAAMLFFEFDHESGHLLTRNGLQPGPRAETAADAYAALRAIQRFGNNCPHLPVLAKWRAQNLLTYRSPHHITGPVLDAIIVDSQRIDFTQLTPEETVAAANDYAARFDPTGPRISFALSQFDGLQRFKSHGNLQIRLAQIALQTHNPLVFQTAARALMSVLADDIGARLPRHSRALIAAQMRDRALAFGLTDILPLLRDDAASLLETPPAANENKKCATLRSRR